MSKSRARFFAEIARSASSLDTLITDTSALSSLASSQADLEALIGTSSLVLPAGTTAERPASPSAGAIRFNTTLNAYEGYDGSKWTILSDVPKVSIDYLIIAGGGGGGSGYAGGGGAGGYREGASSLYLNIPMQITVGAGGTYDASGSNSVLDTFESVGGGAGGARYNAGSAGGSGGGSGGSTTADGGAGTSGQGFNGGKGDGGVTSSGGGGGASANGGNGAGNSGGAGGAGLASSITGSSVTRAGGGGGAGRYSRGLGGSGGGGSGASLSPAYYAGGGAASTGSGGGGGYASGYVYGGGGGSGVIILKVPSGFSASFSAGVTQTSAIVGADTVYTITAAGASDTVTFA